MVIGENSILKQITNARKQAGIANEKERIEFAIVLAVLNSNNRQLTTDNLQEELQKEFKSDFGTLSSDDGWIYTGNNETYYISKNGKVTIGKPILNYKIYGNNTKLPNEYQQVEYIESTGTQYIDTGVETTSGYRIKTNISISKWGEHSEAYFAGFLSQSIYRDYTVFYLENPMIGMNTDVRSSIIANLNTWYSIDASTISRNGYFKLNNDTFVTSSNTVSHDPYNIWIFGVNYYNQRLFLGVFCKNERNRNI